MARAVLGSKRETLPHDNNDHHFVSRAALCVYLIYLVNKKIFTKCINVLVYALYQFLTIQVYILRDIVRLFRQFSAVVKIGKVSPIVPDLSFP